MNGQWFTLKYRTQLDARVVLHNLQAGGAAHAQARQELYGSHGFELIEQSGYFDLIKRELS